METGLRGEPLTPADARDIAVGVVRRGPAGSRMPPRAERAARSARRHHRDLCARLPAAGLAVAVRRGDHPVGCEVAVLPAGAVPGDVVCARRMAVVDAQRLRRLAGDFRSAVAAVLAAPRPARRLQFRDQPARLRCGDLRVSVPGRDRRSSCSSTTAAGIRAARWWRRWRSRSAAPPARASSTPGRSISLVYLPLTLWLLARALDRSSWRAGMAAGVLGGLMAIGRDQVALLSLYVLAGFVLAHWLAGERPLARMRASVKPLAAGGVDRHPGCRRAGHHDHAAGGAIEPARDRLRVGGGAARSTRSICCNSPLPICSAPWIPNVEYWAPQSLIWDAAWGWPGLYLSQNMGLVYAGALPFLALMSFGLIRGVAWAREIRFFTIAAALVLLYALGAYTPAFRLMYDLLPARGALPPAGRCDLRAGRAGRSDRRLPRPSLAHRHGAAGERALQRALEIACAIVLIVRRAGARPFGGRHPAGDRAGGDRRSSSRPRPSRCWCWRAGSMPARRSPRWR